MSVLASLLSTEVPRLPALGVSAVWLYSGWAVVLACLAATGSNAIGLPRRAQFGLAAAIAVWTCIPGSYAPAYWLGLAFQAPSISLVAWCGWVLYRLFAPNPFKPCAQSHRLHFLVWAGIVVGWALLLDTLAVWPASMYPWGFSPVVPAVVVLVLLLPWVLRKDTGALPLGESMLVAVILVFITLRLPSGNAWDALLDPWLWLALHVVAFRSWRQRRSSI